MANKEAEQAQQKAASSFTNETSLPKFGLPIACDKLGLMLCKPKLLPLQSYSFIRMQMQARHQIDEHTTKSTANRKK